MREREPRRERRRRAGYERGGNGNSSDMRRRSGRLGPSLRREGARRQRCGEYPHPRRALVRASCHGRHLACEPNHKQCKRAKRDARQ